MMNQNIWDGVLTRLYPKTGTRSQRFLRAVEELTALRDEGEITDDELEICLRHLVGVTVVGKLDSALGTFFIPSLPSGETNSDHRGFFSNARIADRQYGRVR